MQNYKKEVYVCNARYKFFNFAYISINLQKQTHNTMENTDEMNVAQQKKTSVFQNGLKYGLYTGVASVLFSLLLFSLDVSRESYLQWVSWVILIIGIVLATINYRDKINGGHITFGNAFMTGLYVVIVNSILVMIYSYMYFTWIDPGFTQAMLENVEQKLLDRGMSDEMIEQQLAMTEKFMKPGFMIFWGLFMSVIFGAIISLITSAILKKEDDSFKATFG